METLLKPQDLRRILAFHFLKDSELEALAEIVEILHVGEGERIVEEHDLSPYIYFILEGSVNVLVGSNDRREAYITLLGQGETFGEAGIFPQLERSASISGATDSLVLRIDRKKLLQFISRSTAAGIKVLMMIMYGLLKKIRGLNQELAFERTSDVSQDNIDALVQDFMKQL